MSGHRHTTYCSTNKGYIRQCKSHPYSHDDNSYDFYTYEIEYNDEDRISRVAYSDEWYTYVYKDGVLSGGRYSDMGEVGEMSLGFEQYFNQIPNDKLNLGYQHALFTYPVGRSREMGDVPGTTWSFGTAPYGWTWYGPLCDYVSRMERRG